MSVAAMRLPILFVALSCLFFINASPIPSNHNIKNDSPWVRRQISRYPFCPPQPATEALQQTIFADFIKELYIQKNVTGAYDAHVDVNLIEHSPFGPQGRDANAAVLLNIIPYAQFTVLRSNFDANFGFIHLEIAGSPEPTALADIYRMNGTCIEEHWDVTQVEPSNATNPIAMF
ncbi:hypothetical protein MMC15_007497 [Xylographa vitiligo]|nr:hypothetical protein [Xylographa vitiligo]